LVGYKISVSTHLDNEFDVIKPKLHKSGNAIAFEYLIVPNIPCDLDYVRIVFGLCDILLTIYKKI